MRGVRKGGGGAGGEVKVGLYICHNILLPPFVSGDLQKFEDTGDVESLPFDLDTCSATSCGTEPLEWFVIHEH